MKTTGTGGVDRRTFVKAAGAGVLGVGAIGPRTLAAGDTRLARRRRVRPARHVVFMVSDGCSTGTIGLADEVRRMAMSPEVRRAIGCGPTAVWSDLWGREGVRRAMQRTASANSLVTDSAAASSAWSIGRKTDNGAICVMPDGSEGEPILVSAKRKGMATGLVSTTRVTHATPAAFVANVARRSQEDAIARQIIERRVDVVLGGGAEFFPDGLMARHEQVRVVRTAGELAAFGFDGAGERVLGVFADGHMAYEIDREDEEPSLAMMSERALSLLGGRGDGFVLQIEGGRVDHAAHANDAAGLVRDQLAFDDAVGVVAAWAARRDDTLVVVTSDHGNANPGLTLYLGQASDGLGVLASARWSFDWIAARLGALRDADALTDDAARAVVREATGVDVGDEAWAMVMRAMVEGGVEDAFRARRSWMHVLGSALGNANGVGFVSGNHTADYTEVTAMGPGSERFGGLMDNTEVGAAVRAALDL